MEVNDKLISELIYFGRNQEAYLLLSNMKEDKAWVLYNMALILAKNGRYAEAIGKLDKMQALMAPLPAPRAENELAKKIAAKDAQEYHHLLPLDEAYTTLFPHMVKDNVLRLKVDCHVGAAQWNEVVKIAAQLANRGYRNVEWALEKAEMATGRPHGQIKDNQ